MKAFLYFMIIFAECEQGTFGQNCSLSCDCAEGTACDPVSGKCLCSSGKTGVRCDSGKSLYLPSRIRTRLVSLFTSALFPVCDFLPRVWVLDCRVNQYGPDCALSCECENGADCDSRNGRCTCLNGWIGLTCTEGKISALRY